MNIPILYEDNWICAVNKPGKIQSHSTDLDKKTDNVVDLLKDAIGTRYYPVHRLDRGTSGVLLLVKDKSFVSQLQHSLQNLPHAKKYVAIVRGQTAKAGLIVREMEDAYSTKIQFSKSTYKTLEQFSSAIPNRPHPNTCFSSLLLEPITGRTHQLRRHLSKIARPIVGDMEYGDSSLNKFFRNQFGELHLLLHARELMFWHPFLKEKILIGADVPSYFLDFKNYCLRPQ